MWFSSSVADLAVRGHGEGHASATERLRTKPPLCQECAKTGRYSPTHRGQEENQKAAELGICRRHRTVRNAVDGPAGIYTPAVGGSIPQQTPLNLRQRSPRTQPTARSQGLVSRSVNSAWSPGANSPRKASPSATPSRTTTAPTLGEILPSSLTHCRASATARSMCARSPCRAVVIARFYWRSRARRASAESEDRTIERCASCSDL